MSSVPSPNKSSRRTYSNLSCMSKRPDSDAFIPPGDTAPLKIIKRPTIGVVATQNSRPFHNNHLGSGGTLDDASSLVDQSSSAVSPIKQASSKSSLAGSSVSQSDLLGINCALNSITITMRESLHVRALFRYNPDTDRGRAARASFFVLMSTGLAFDHGDILYVVNASDQEWWQAQYAYPIAPPSWFSSAGSVPALNSLSRLPSSSADNQLFNPNTSASSRPAIIPSQGREERRLRRSAKRVKFVDKTVDNGGNSGDMSPWSIGTGSGETPNIPYALESSNRFFGGDGSLASLSAVSGVGGGGVFPSADSVSAGGTLERRKKTNSLSIFKRFSSRRGRKDLEANPAMKKKSISLEDMQSGGKTVQFSIL
ncbi:unnamed protein product [Rodentolepis nana]|uniref:SH3 domain-containing protein n=1 Tax=Rodentolepis nana TaxID=102285 RepID=A0A158QGH2_RODNA|nr:unnamed protein product [Rodentolepis nana]